MQRKIFFFLLFLSIASPSIARPFQFNLDTIYTYSDFCDRVDILFYNGSEISVKAHSDSLTYTFYTNRFLENDFNISNKYILIRGRASSEEGSNQCVVLGKLVGDEYVFNKLEEDFCCYQSSNPIAVQEGDDLIGKVKYPKNYFKLKTPSLTWNEQEREAYQPLFKSYSMQKINLKNCENYFFNDSIYVSKDVLDKNHIRLTFHFKRSNKHEMDAEETIPSILKTMGIPYKNIIENNKYVTYEWHHHHHVLSYSNKNYKLITYKVFNNLVEDMVILDLHQ